MRALVIQQPGQVGVAHVENPVAREDEIIVAPRLAGICGTDLELIDGSIDPSYVRYPLILGHEWVGELTGDVVSLGRAGDRVVVEGVVPCGVCDECRRGDTNRCVTYEEIGFTRPGAIAEEVAVPTRLVHRLEPAVSLDDAVLTEPMAVVWRALGRVPLRAGLRVAVIGDGTIALLAAYLVRLLVPSLVVVVGRRAAQAELARRAGADDFTTEVPDEHFDLVIEAAGNVVAVSTALSLGARGAIIVLLGLPEHGLLVEFAPDDVVNNDLIIQGSFSYTRTAWEHVVGLLNAGEVKPSFLITHRFDLDTSIQAVSALRHPRDEFEPRGKVVVTL